MIVVLIWWKILPGREDDFLRWWQIESEPKDKAPLFGEYLSRPRRADSLPYKSTDLFPVDGTHVPFVNIGIWKDEESFRSVIGPRDDLQKKDFEFEYRTRTVLTVEETHQGEWSGQFNQIFRNGPE